MSRAAARDDRPDVDYWSQLPRNRDGRRQKYQELRAELTAADPMTTLARLHAVLDQLAHHTGRPSDPQPIGTWVPQFTVLAMREALASAQRALLERERGTDA